MTNSLADSGRSGSVRSGSVRSGSVRSGSVRLARWSATHPGRAISLWLVFVIGCLALGMGVHLNTVTDRDQAVGQSGMAARWLHSAGLDDPDVEDVLITARTGPFDAAAAGTAAAEVTHRMTSLADVASVAAPQTSADGQAVLVAVTMRGDPDTATDRVAALVAATRAVQQQNPQLRIEQAGNASLSSAVNSQVGSDLSTAADVSLPITLAIMLVAFGAIIAAGVPVLLALSAVASATGLSTIASHLIPDSGTTSSMILLMGMAVGVDYSLFYVKRAREERARGVAHLDAIELAARTSGHSVIVSGVAVIVSMLGLFIAQDAVFSSLAAGSILVVTVAVLGSLTVLPAVLAKLGRLIDRPRIPVLWRLSMSTREARLWPILLRPALTHPARTLACSVGAMVLLALPALGLSLHSGSPASLPRSIPTVQTYDRLTATFPSSASTTLVVVRSSPAQAASVRAGLQSLAGQLDPALFDRATATVRASADGSVHELSVDVDADAGSSQAKQAVVWLRSGAAARSVADVPGSTWAVGGDAAVSIDYDRHLSERLPWVIGFVVVLTMLMMAITFRSIVLALITAFVNLLSAGAAFGVLVLTFQHTWAEGLLDFHSTGTVITWIPLFTFAVLFGLSMDYHVFVVGRIREAAADGLSVRAAVRQGIVGSAGTVTSAAIVMVSVFSIFASLHMVEMKELGVGLATAVLVDALVVRVIILPALMIVFGRAVWWPGPLARRRSVPVAERERATALAG